MAGAATRGSILAAGIEETGLVGVVGRGGGDVGIAPDVGCGVGAAAGGAGAAGGGITGAGAAGAGAAAPLETAPTPNNYLYNGKLR